MPLLSLFAAIGLLLVLVLVAKLDAFFALLIAAFAVGVLNGMSALATLHSLVNGFAATLESVALILIFGSMLGALAAESGAARAIAHRLVDVAGRRRIQIAMAATGFVVGLPMLYNAGFLVLIPVIYGLAETTGLSLIYVGVPLASALSVTHGFLPPHPAPTFMAFTYHADLSRTLALGLVAAVPACLVGGVGLARVLSRFHIRATPPDALRVSARGDDHVPPSAAISIATMLVPVVLMLVGALANAVTHTSVVVGNATVALFVGLVVALYTFGVRRGVSVGRLCKQLGGGVRSIAMILLVIAGGGAFSQVLRDAGVGDYVAARAAGLRVDPLLLAFGLASLMRLAVGSATVAGMTTAGLVAPLVTASHASPELMVLATGAGSLMFSHFNDTGFWMFKEYFGLTVPETLATWSLMEMTVASVGFGMVLLMRVVV